MPRVVVERGCETSVLPIDGDSLESEGSELGTDFFEGVEKCSRAVVQRDMVGVQRNSQIVECEYLGVTSAEVERK